MSLYARSKSWLRAAATRSRLEREMDEELAFHLENYTQELIRRGLAPEEAARRARMELGAITMQKENMRAALGLRLWDDLRADLRYAVRQLAKSPGFTAVAIGSLALGIGANTAIFTLAKQILLDRLAVPHPEQLLLFRWVAPEHSLVHHTWGDWDKTPGGMLTSTSFPYPVYEQLRRENQVLSDLFAFKGVGHLTAMIDGQASVVQAEMVSGNYYQGLGIRPALGRPILPPDNAVPGSGAVIVISDQFWTKHFGRSPSVIGKTIDLNLKPVTIIGVNPADFTGAKGAHASPDVFLPFSMQPVLLPRTGGSILEDREYWWMQIMARPKAGVPFETARSSLDVAFRAAARFGVKVKKDEAVPTLELVDGSRGLNEIARTLTQPVYVLMALAGLVLLLACANIANLLLARSAAREREMAVRVALGAGRNRILRQVLTESLFLSSLGGAAGLTLGYLGRNVIPSLFVPPWEVVGLQDNFDWRVFAFTAAITLLTGLLFGLAPIWQATRTPASSGLKDNAQTITHRRKGIAGKSIIAFQVMLSTLLVAGAVLFVRTLINLGSVDPGFKTDHLLLFEIEPPRVDYPPPKDIAVLHDIELRLRAVPGIEAVTSSMVPLIANDVNIDDFIPTDRPKGERKESDHGAWDNVVAQNFFHAIGIPILAGRGFNENDTETSTKAAVINQKLAREYYPGTNPIGKSFRGSGSDDTFQIVGVCADAHYDSLRDAIPDTYYVPYVQLSGAGGSMTYEIRTRAKPEGMVTLVRRAVQSVDKNLPLIDVRTQTEQIDATMQQERTFASLTAAFGILALVLACIGIYGLMAYTVARRTNEIGIRLALGAPRQQVVGMILGEAFWLAMVGVGAGLGIALLATRSLQSMLFGLKPNDPATLLLSGVLLLCVALLASFIPARAAARVNPIQALRHE
jgi:predicted permease